MTRMTDEAIDALMAEARVHGERAHAPYSSFRVGAAVARGHQHLVALAVSCLDGDPAQPSTLMPCGACRQVMVELLRPDALVVVDGVGSFDLDQLLPNPFRL
jgi:cytidine deaminase